MHNDRIQQSELKESKILYGDIVDKNMLIQSLFPEEYTNDTRSINYQRTLVRPAIKWGELCLNIILLLILSVGIFYITRFWGTAHWVAVFNVVMFTLGYCFIRLKRIILSIVHLYQRFAPESIRNRCRFEPSCSEYMILVVSQYGAFKGMRKGVQRLKRCNLHGGGYDWPQ